MSFELPPFSPSANYGWFGYHGALCVQAIRSRNLPMLQACLDQGLMDANSEVLGFKNVVEFCDARGYPECAELIRNHRSA